MSNISDLAAACIRCGFCLESCPTFGLSGEETESPRGRIYLIRSAEAGQLDWEEARPHLDSCLGCRACETACPSGVQYGELLELAREKLETDRPQRTKKLLLSGLTDARLARLQFAFSKLIPGGKMPGFLSRALAGAPAEAELPRPQAPADWPPLTDLPPVVGQVVLLEGCAMRVLFPRVHEATRRLLRRLGYETVGIDLGCCGALHAHAGYRTEGHARAQEVMKRAAGRPIIVNAAGCGAHLKSVQKEGVFDVHEFLAAHGGIELMASGHLSARVTYHDACHLTHGQKIRSQPRRLLKAIRGVQWVDLPESDHCCGSAGIYNLLQPANARALLDRKWGHVEGTGAAILATGNPGCHAWIEQAAREHGGRVRVAHPVELMEEALQAGPRLAEPDQSPALPSPH